MRRAGIGASAMATVGACDDVTVSGRRPAQPASAWTLLVGSGARDPRSAIAIAIASPSSGPDSFQ
jgi:hypothetical protein